MAGSRARRWSQYVCSCSKCKIDVWLRCWDLHHPFTNCTVESTAVEARRKERKKGRVQGKCKIDIDCIVWTFTTLSPIVLLWEEEERERKGGRVHPQSAQVVPAHHGKGRAHLLSRSVNTFPTFDRAIMCGCEEYFHSLSQVALPQSSPWQTRCKQLSTRCLKAGEEKMVSNFHSLDQDLLCERTRCKKHCSGVSKTSYCVSKPGVKNIGQVSEKVKLLSVRASQV